MRRAKACCPLRQGVARRGARTHTHAGARGVSDARRSTRSWRKTLAACSHSNAHGFCTAVDGAKRRRLASPSIMCPWEQRGTHRTHTNAHQRTPTHTHGARRHRGAGATTRQIPFLKWIIVKIVLYRLHFPRGAFLFLIYQKRRMFVFVLCFCFLRHCPTCTRPLQCINSPLSMLQAEIGLMKNAGGKLKNFFGFLGNSQQSAKPLQQETPTCSCRE